MFGSQREVEFKLEKYFRAIMFFVPKPVPKSDENTHSHKSTSNLRYLTC